MKMLEDKVQHSNKSWQNNEVYLEKLGGNDKNTKRLMGGWVLFSIISQIPPKASVLPTTQNLFPVFEKLLL